MLNTNTIPVTLFLLLGGCGAYVDPASCYSEGRDCSNGHTEPRSQGQTEPLVSGQPTPERDRGPAGERGRDGIAGPVGPSGETGPSGTAGPAGATGAAGTAGLPCSVSVTGLMSCPDGTSYQIPAGAAGPQGQAGSSCSVVQLSNAARIICTDGTESVIYNGQNAVASPYDVVEVIDPCGDESGFDEVLLRLANNQLLAHYSDVNKQFLVLIGPGSYRTTDGHNCLFIVSNNMQVTW